MCFCPLCLGLNYETKFVKHCNGGGRSSSGLCFNLYSISHKVVTLSFL